MKMVMYMKGIGRMIRQMVTVNTFKRMEQYLKGRGKKTNNMEKEWKYGEIRPNMKEIILKEKNMDKECFPFKMEVTTREASKITLSMAQELLNGKVGKSIQEIG